MKVVVAGAAISKKFGAIKHSRDLLSPSRFSFSPASYNQPIGQPQPTTPLQK
jgi:hypothetical protein